MEGCGPPSSSAHCKEQCARDPRGAAVPVNRGSLARNRHFLSFPAGILPNAGRNAHDLNACLRVAAIDLLPKMMLHDRLPHGRTCSSIRQQKTRRGWPPGRNSSVSISRLAQNGNACQGAFGHYSPLESCPCFVSHSRGALHYGPLGLFESTMTVSKSAFRILAITGSGGTPFEGSYHGAFFATPA